MASWYAVATVIFKSWIIFLTTPVLLHFSKLIFDLSCFLLASIWTRRPNSFPAWRNFSCFFSIYLQCCINNDLNLGLLNLTSLIHWMILSIEWSMSMKQHSKNHSLSSPIVCISFFLSIGCFLCNRNLMINVYFLTLCRAHKHVKHTSATFSTLIVINFAENNWKNWSKH